MNNQTQSTAFDLAFKEGYTIRLETVAGGYIVTCIATREKQRIYRVCIVDLAELFWAIAEAEACIEGYESRQADMKAEHPTEVIARAQVLVKQGIKGALGAAYAGRPMRTECSGRLPVQKSANSSARESS